MTKAPTNTAEFKEMAKGMAKKKAKEELAKRGLPTSKAEVKAMAKKKAGAALAKHTGGLITRVPTSKADAIALAKEIIKKKGMPYYTKYTGMTKVPTNTAEFKEMVKGMAKKKAKEELAKRGLPTSKAEVKAMAKKKA